jgi:hypothetical protein
LKKNNNNMGFGYEKIRAIHYLATIENEGGQIHTI